MFIYSTIMEPYYIFAISALWQLPTTLTFEQHFKMTIFHINKFQTFSTSQVLTTSAFFSQAGNIMHFLIWRTYARTIIEF